MYNAQWALDNSLHINITYIDGQCYDTVIYSWTTTTSWDWYLCDKNYIRSCLIVWTILQWTTNYIAYKYPAEILVYTYLNLFLILQKQNWNQELINMVTTRNYMVVQHYGSCTNNNNVHFWDEAAGLIIILICRSKENIISYNNKSRILSRLINFHRCYRAMVRQKSELNSCTLQKH